VLNARTLFVVSASVPSGHDSTSGPRKDYLVAADALHAALLGRSAIRCASRLTRLLARLSVPLAQAWLAFQQRQRYDVFVTDGEHIGIPLALLLKLVRARNVHVTIGHRITAGKKRPFFRWLRVHTHLSRIVLHARRQFDLARTELGIPAERLALLPYQVDTQFWQPLADVDEEHLVCSAGLEFRDYPTLERAVDGLNAKVIIGAASHWSKRRNTAAGSQHPANVEVDRFDYAGLRALYARSAVVVVPLDDIDFQAGVTTILEAMAMAKPVVVTHSQGQTDVVEDRRTTTRGGTPRSRPGSLLRQIAAEAAVEVEPTGFYVLPGDAEGLRRAIAYLLDNPPERRRLGAAGRRTVERLLTVEQFGERLRKLVEDACATDAARPNRTSAAARLQFDGAR
jgi:glycosyltransferase involved in cell wall biosynthesis